MNSFQQSALTFHPENGGIIQIILLPSLPSVFWRESFHTKHIDCGSLITKYIQRHISRHSKSLLCAAQSADGCQGPHMCLVKFLIYWAAIWIVSGLSFPASSWPEILMSAYRQRASGSGQPESTVHLCGSRDQARRRGAPYCIGLVSGLVTLISVTSWRLRWQCGISPFLQNDLHSPSLRQTERLIERSRQLIKGFARVLHNILQDIGIKRRKYGYWIVSSRVPLAILNMLPRVITMRHF